MSRRRGPTDALGDVEGIVGRRPARQSRRERDRGASRRLDGAARAASSRRRRYLLVRSRLQERCRACRERRAGGGRADAVVRHGRASHGLWRHVHVRHPDLPGGAAVIPEKHRTSRLQARVHRQRPRRQHRGAELVPARLRARDQPQALRHHLFRALEGGPRAVPRGPEIGTPRLRGRDVDDDGGRARYGEARPAAAGVRHAQRRSAQGVSRRAFGLVQDHHRERRSRRCAPGQRAQGREAARCVRRRTRQHAEEPRDVGLMVENRPFNNLLPHLILWIGIAIVPFPVYLAFIGSTHEPTIISNGQMPLTPGGHFFKNYYRTIFIGTSGTTREPVYTMLLNSFVMAMVIACGKIFISILSAYAIVYFKFPLRMSAFWIIFITLMLPVEVRIYPTYKIASDLNLLDTYAGLTLPLVASATATLLFRQFFMTVPDELVEASRIDGAGPFRFFWDTLLPLSRTNMAALFVILFIYGWNQYLWPLLITTRDDMQTIVIGIKKMIVTSDALTEWQLVMATAILAMLPPVLVVIGMQRLFVRGLVETEK